MKNFIYYIKSLIGLLFVVLIVSVVVATGFNNHTYALVGGGAVILSTIVSIISNEPRQV